MGASPNWLDKYQAPLPSDATSAAPVSPAPMPQPSVGAAVRPDWAMHAMPKPFGDHVQQALNALGLGNPLPHMYDAVQQMKTGHPLGSLLSAAAAVPLLPELGGERLAGGLLGELAPATESVGAHAFALTGHEQKYADLLRRQGVANPVAQALKELRGIDAPASVDAPGVRDILARIRQQKEANTPHPGLDFSSGEINKGLDSAAVRVARKL